MATLRTSANSSRRIFWPGVAGAWYGSTPLRSGTGSVAALTVPTAVTGISSTTMIAAGMLPAIPGKAASAALASPVLSGVINGSLSISVCARISDRLAAGRVITLAWRKGHRTFPVARPESPCWSVTARLWCEVLCTPATRWATRSCGR